MLISVFQKGDPSGPSQEEAFLCQREASTTHLIELRWITFGRSHFSLHHSCLLFVAKRSIRRNGDSTKRAHLFRCFASMDVARSTRATPVSAADGYPGELKIRCWGSLLDLSGCFQSHCDVWVLDRSEREGDGEGEGVEMEREGGMDIGEGEKSPRTSPSS